MASLRKFFRQTEKNFIRPIVKGGSYGLMTGNPYATIACAMEYREAEKEADKMREYAREEEEAKLKALRENQAQLRGIQSARGITDSTLADIQGRELLENTGNLVSPYRYQADQLTSNVAGKSIGYGLRDLYYNRQLARKGEKGLKTKILPTRGLLGAFGRTLNI